MIINPTMLMNNNEGDGDEDMIDLAGYTWLQDIGNMIGFDIDTSRRYLLSKELLFLPTNCGNTPNIVKFYYINKSNNNIDRVLLSFIVGAYYLAPVNAGSMSFVDKKYVKIKNIDNCFIESSQHNRVMELTNVSLLYK